MQSKHILVVISKDIIRRNILDTAFWPSFLSELPAGVKVVLIVGDKNVADVRETYSTDRVVVEGYERTEHHGLQKVLNFLIRTGINSHSTRTYRNRALHRNESSCSSYFIKGLLANTLGRFTWYKCFLRYLFAHTKAPQTVYDLFDTYKPIAVFAPSMIDNEFDAQFARVAKQCKSKLLGMVRSWDNLNNHGVLSVVPEVWYFQNLFLKEMAVKMQGINMKKVLSQRVGLPHYDAYYSPGGEVMNRKVFMEGMGLDTKKKLILLGGSDFYYSEDTLPKKLNDAIESGAITEPVQVVFRPHPARIFDLEEYQLSQLQHVVLNDAFSGVKRFTDADTFLNLLYHSDIIMNIASTLSIDAAVFDTPAICVNFDDEERKLSHYESVHRLYDHFDHYERLVVTGGVRTPDSSEQLIADINDYLANQELDKEGRKKIVETFVAPFDGKASQRLAQQVAADVADLL